MPISERELIVYSLEELGDIRAHDDAKGDTTEAIAFEQAISEDQ
ncbi:MAG: hypothetical protein P4L43_15560 [Syntrophobacteraceae bacterium]|nr:hypothetical protein [Syntrophobacteraceae bacterium]